MSSRPNKLPDRSELEKIIHSPAGRQLLSFLQTQNSAELNAAVEKASAGDLNSAKEIIERIMSSYNGDWPGKMG